MKKWFLGLLVAFIAQAAFATQVQMKEGAPDVYYVKKGDTLWDISNVFLNDPWLWPEIWHINPQIENPHLIYPEDKLSLVMVNGEKRVTVTERTHSGNVVKMSPGEVNGSKHISPRVRITPVDAAIPAIPLEKINPFLTKSRVVTKQIIEDGPYVIAGNNKRLLTGPGDTLYARGNFEEDNRVFGIYRPGKPFIDPETKEVLGLEAMEVGSGRVVKLDEDIATFLVNKVREEIRINDRLLPREEEVVTARFEPHAPKEDIEGLVISIENGVTQFGPWDIVAINRGERDEMEVGHILAISQTGEVVKDHIQNQTLQLPDERAGLMMIFRTFEKMSFGIVLKADRPLYIGDKVHKP